MTADSKTPQTYGPYSPLRRAGNLCFVSGQVGITPGTTDAANDVTVQTRQALENLQTVLAAESLGTNHVVKIIIYLKDMADFAAVNSVYESFFESPRPARSTVEVAGLPKIGAVTLLVEIEAIAYKDAGATA